MSASLTKRPRDVAVIFAPETIGEALASGLEDLIHAEYEEVEKGDFPINIDWPQTMLLERTGRWKGISARRGGRLIGFNGYFITCPTRHKGQLWAINDAIFLDKAHRGGMLGFRFLRESEAILKAAGCVAVQHGDRKPYSTKPETRATFGDVLERIGYRMSERVYVKRL